MTDPGQGGPLRILVIDDNPGDRRLVTAELAFLEGDRIATVGVGTLAEGIAAAAVRSFDAAILDMGLPDSQGLDTVKGFVTAAPELPVVVLTGLDDRQVGIAAVRAGAQDYLVKGDVRGDLLERALRHAMERKRIEEQLRDSEARLRAILADSPVGVAISRIDGSLVFLNRRLAEMHALSPDQFADREALDFYANPADRGRLVEAAQAGRPLRDAEIRFRRADGSLYWALVTMLPTHLAGEDALLTWIYDISARKAAEEAQRAAKERAEREARARTDFLAMMSHEIRTPMTGVLGMVRLLQHDDLTPAQRDCVETIAYSGDALMTIVDDALDITRLDAGRLELENREFDPRRMIHSVVHLMASRAAEKGLRMRADIDTGVPALLLGDTGRLRQILLNLIGNAVKFSERGEVIVAVRPFDAENGGGEGASLRFEVRDNGPGIPANQIITLFEPYVQGDATIAGRHGGSGLGLAICRRLVHLMGGEIGAESDLGAGSVFWFTLPLARSLAPHVPKMGAAADDAAPGRTPAVGLAAWDAWPEAPLRVLLAEDNPVNQKVVAGFLAHMGHTVRIAADGAEAVRLAAGDEGFDVVLMDIQMPRLNGLEATAAIRRLPGAVAQVPILALTADVYPEDVERCIRGGMNGHVAKPVQPENLARTLRRIQRGEATATARRPAAPPLIGGPSAGVAAGHPAFEAAPVVSLVRELGPEFLRDLLASFIREARRDVAALAAFDADITTPALRRRAHDLKATAGNFGLMALSERAGDVEKATRENRLADARALAHGLPGDLNAGLDALGREFPALVAPGVVHFL